MSSDIPKLTGGCLCGAVRYTISPLEWPPKSNGSCQCTMCRKFTGGLKQDGCTFPNSSISPPLADNSTYTVYTSSEKGARGFCNVCGSSLTFHYIGRDKTEILLGTIDEHILRSEVGSQLCDSRACSWGENAVKGITDKQKGVMWKQETGSEKLEGSI